MKTLNKQQRKLYRLWLTGRINMIVAARRLGYKGNSLHKGVEKVRNILSDMGVHTTA